MIKEGIGISLVVAGGAIILAQRAIAALQERRGVELHTPYGNPPPRRPHVSLPPSTTNYKRVIIVGDIHGCAEELQALLDRVRYRQGVDLLLSVGDLVNKGPDSVQVLRMALENGMQAVRGNHDDSAYGAFRCWLEGRDIPKPDKHGWVAGLEEGLAAYLASLPYTLTLPAYGVVLVHAGLVPGVPLELQSMEDMEKMRDVVPAAAAATADASAAALADGADVATLPAATFDWEAASTALGVLAAAGSRAGAEAGGEPPEQQGGEEAAAEAAAEPPPPPALLPPALALEAREVPNPLGRAWASIWRGPPHVFFGHDAKRRLQLGPAATGLDTGCVYGGQLTAAVLPPLDDHGQPLLQRLNLPPDAEEIALCSGVPAFLVQVPATEVHSDKFLRSEQQEAGERQDAAKAHAEAAALELATGAGGPSAASKSVEAKKRE